MGKKLCEECAQEQWEIRTRGRESKIKKKSAHFRATKKKLVWEDIKRIMSGVRLASVSEILV